MKFKNMGTLEVITGSMFSGKSEELIRRLIRAKYAKQKIVVFKHSIDNRYGEAGIFSHSNDTLEAFPVNSIEKMEEILQKNIDVEVIGIDEVQFFGEKVVNFCKKYVNLGKRVIVAGLDMSFRAEPYHPMPELMSISDEVDKFHAICTVCGKLAYASQRLINGEPAYYDDPLVMVGASENYEARCRQHHILKYRENKAKIYFILGTEIQVGKKKAEEFYLNYLENKENKKLKSETIILNTININENFDDKKILDIRNKIDISMKKNDILFVRIVGGISMPIQGNYTVLDFICEYRKDSEIILVSKNKKGISNTILLLIDVLKKADLNINKILYNNNNIEYENDIFIEKIKEITKIEYIKI